MSDNIHYSDVINYLQEKGETDETFRKKLLDDPNGTIRKEISKKFPGIAVPDDINFNVVINSAATYTLVLNPSNDIKTTVY